MLEDVTTILFSSCESKLLSLHSPQMSLPNYESFYEQICLVRYKFIVEQLLKTHLAMQSISFQGRAYIATSNVICKIKKLSLHAKHQIVFQKNFGTLSRRKKGILVDFATCKNFAQIDLEANEAYREKDRTTSAYLALPHASKDIYIASCNQGA